MSAFEPSCASDAGEADESVDTISEMDSSSDDDFSSGASSNSSAAALSDSDEDGASPPRPENTRSAHPHLTGKRVLLTGGAGFIGSHVAEVLLARGDEVLIVDEVNDYYDVRLKRANLKRLQERWGDDRLRVYEGDVCNEPFISKIFESEKPRWVVHLAARAGVRPSIQDPFIYIHSNVEATTRLLELARTHGNEHFVFASSSSVYGGSKNEVFSEADVVDFPVSPYAATKKACELMSYTYHHLYGLNVAGLRFFTVYGPRGRPDMAPFKFVDRVSRGVEIQQFGDGSSSRDYTYIDDIVDGVVRSMDRPLGYQIYNLGNGNPVGLKHFIGIVEEATGKKANIRVLPDQPGDVPRTAADISKARRLLGYEPKVAFADGIHRLAEWYRTEYAQLEEEPETLKPIAKSTSMVSFALGSHNEAGIL
jgi:UDP-glucuronate 4-epimerase